MKCGHLKGWTIAVCRVDEKPYVPSVFQLEEYCKTSRHKRCPFLAKNTCGERKVNGRVAVREYA
jgi:hypothetical protein